MSKSRELRRDVDETPPMALPVVSDSALSRQQDQEQITIAVAEIAKSRATIDQAKGMLMCIYGIDAEEAFGLLRWQSQHHNVKLRTMAEQVISDFRAAAVQQLPTRRAYDELLVTVHTRTGTPILTNAVKKLAERMAPTDQ